MDNNGYDMKQSSFVSSSSFHIPPQNSCDFSWVTGELYSVNLCTACREASDRFSILTPE